MCRCCNNLLIVMTIIIFILRHVTSEYHSMMTCFSRCSDIMRSFLILFRVVKIRPALEGDKEAFLLSLCVRTFKEKVIIFRSVASLSHWLISMKCSMDGLKSNCSAGYIFFVQIPAGNYVIFLSYSQQSWGFH
jgi:hypothetical protein